MKILKDLLVVLQHQYAGYLASSNNQLMVREAIKSTTVHNTATEEEVGMVPGAQKKATGETIVFRASIIKRMRNRSVHHLSDVPTAELHTQDHIKCMYHLISHYDAVLLLNY